MLKKLKTKKFAIFAVIFSSVLILASIAAWIIYFVM